MKKTTLSFLLLTFSLSLCAQNLQPLFTAPWGVQAYTFRNMFPRGILTTLDTIKLLGFTEIEGGNPRGMSPEDFKAACDARGISIPSTGGDYNQLVKDQTETIKKAKIFGAKYVMCAWIPHTKGNFTLENAKKAVEDFNKIGKTMKENGLTFCYHAHGFEFQKYGDGTLLDYIIQNTNPDDVSFEMDVLWITHGGGNPVELLKKYGNRWKLMHVKDLKKGIIGDLTGGTPAENDVPVGYGQADFYNIIKLGNEIGIKHFFIEDESNIELLNIPKSMAYLKSLQAPVAATTDAKAPWQNLFNGSDLKGWDTYLGTLFTGKNGKKRGKTPIGLNIDPQQVFSIVTEDGEKAIRISGEHFGGISTEGVFENYHLQLQFKWGKLKWHPKKNARMDSGLLYHANGEHGADGGFWMQSQEFQIQEKDCGDYWGVAGAIMDIPTQKVNDSTYIYDPLSIKRTFMEKTPVGRHAIKNPDGENPTGEWNTLDLYCLGDTAVHVVNGKVVMVLYNSKHPVNGKMEALTKGKIQVQSEGGEVFYRHIQIVPINGLPEDIVKK